MLYLFAHEQKDRSKHTAEMLNANSQEPTTATSKKPEQQTAHT